jgi:hypothetical protein
MGYIVATIRPFLNGLAIFSGRPDNGFVSAGFSTG